MTTAYLKRSLENYLTELSSDSPVPGGGGTSAFVAALGMALEIMVARIASKRLDETRKKEIGALISELETLMKSSACVVDSDPEVYERVMSAYKSAKNEPDPKKGEAEIERALTESFRHQEALARKIYEAKKRLASVGAIAKGSIRNDLFVAKALLDGAFTGAYRTALINVVYMKDIECRKNHERGLEELKKEHEGIVFE